MCRMERVQSKFIFADSRPIRIDSGQNSLLSIRAPQSWRNSTLGVWSSWSPSTLTFWGICVEHSLSQSTSMDFLYSTLERELSQPWMPIKLIENDSRCRQYFYIEISKTWLPQTVFPMARSKDIRIHEVVLLT